MKGPLDGRKEHRETTVSSFGLEVYDQVKRLDVTFGEHLRYRAKWEALT